MPEQQTAVFYLLPFILYGTRCFVNSYYFKKINSTPIPMKTHILIYNL